MLCPSVDILGIPSAQGISDSPAAWRSLHASSPSASERCSYRRCSDWSPISWQKKAKGQREFDHPRWFFADKTRIFMIFQYLPISAFSRDLSSRITVLQGTQTMAVSFGSTIDFVDAGWPHSKWSFRPILALLLGRAKPRIYAWWISWGQTKMNISEHLQQSVINMMFFWCMK